ncbi:MAG: nitrate transporter substrate-binding protein [Hyphomicrobiales bacterium]|nr:nitrate transporter substrate-binding protein [Hyphomicrobiales bacterium]
MRLLSTLTAAALSMGMLGASAQAQTQVRVGFIPVLGTAPIFVVDKEGWAKEAGLDFKFTTFESGPVMIQALASGTLDVYVAGVAPLGVARSKGIDVKVVAATAIEEMTVAAGSKLAPYFKEGVSPAEAFKAYRAATGKPARLATQPPGSVPHTTLTHWLNEVTKTDKADVDVVPMGIDATQQALLSGAVDGATIREPTDTIVQNRDKRIKIVALGGQMFPNQPGTVVAVSGAFLQKNPEGVQKIVSGIVRAIDLIKTDPKRVAPAIEGALGKGLIDTDTIVAALASPASKFESNPAAIVEATKKMQAYQVSIGTLDKDVPLDGLFDASFYQKAIAK